MLNVQVQDDVIARLVAAIEQVRRVTSDRTPTGVLHDDADDVIGTIATDSAAGFDPLPLLRALDHAGVRVVVIGQVAGILHGSTELTGDLDLLWDGDPSQAQGLTTVLAAVGARLLDDEGPIALHRDAFALPKVRFESEAASGDLCTPALPWGELDIHGFIDRALCARGADGSLVHYLRREDLIAMREVVGRPKDLRRADELRRIR